MRDFFSSNKRKILSNSFYIHKKIRNLVNKYTTNMRKKTLYIVIGTILILTSCNTRKNESNETIIPATNSDTSQLKKKHQKTYVFTPQEYQIPEKVIYFPLEGPYLVDNFRPIGFSDKAMFAYIIEPADEACDCYHFKLYIQNLKNDHIEWKFEVQKETDKVDYNIDSVWNVNDSLFSAKLNEYRIVQQKDINIQKDAIELNGKKYFYQFKKQTQFDSEYQIDWVKMGTLKISEENTPEKSEFIYKETAYAYVLNAGLSGYIKSKIDNQLAFVLWHARWGYEGTPYVVSFKIVGTKLD